MRFRQREVCMDATLKAAFWLSLVSIPVWAQTPTAELTGTVTDPSGAVISGAQIIITSP
jgi:hypothetical protein